MIANAVYNREYDEAKKLIKEGKDVNERDEYGSTAIRYAACYGDVKLVRLLIAANADIHGHDNDGWTPLDYAVSGNHRRVCYWLVKHGADVNTENTRGGRPLHRACCWFHLLVACLLLEYGAIPDGGHHPTCSYAAELLNNKTQLRHLMPRELVALTYEFLV